MIATLAVQATQMLLVLALAPRLSSRALKLCPASVFWASRATAMRLLAGPSLPGLRPADVTFASNQVRLRLPASPLKGWTLTRAVVERLSATSA